MQKSLRSLRRARSGRWLGGVCSGVARWLGWSVGTVRVLWLLVSVIPILPGLPAYLLAWLLVPLEEPPPGAGSPRASDPGLR